MTAPNPWQPILGDDIGPSRAERTRSGLTLGVVVIVLGICLAAGLGLAVMSVFALFGAAVG